MGASSKVCEFGASKYGLPVKVWGPLGKYRRLAQPSMPLVKYGSLSQWGGRCWASNLSSTRLDCPTLLPHTRQSRFPSYFLSYFHCPLLLLPTQACTKLWVRDVLEKLRNYVLTALFNNNDAYVDWSYFNYFFMRGFFPVTQKGAVFVQTGVLSIYFVLFIHSVLLWGILGMKPHDTHTPVTRWRGWTCH